MSLNSLAFMGKTVDGICTAERMNRSDQSALSPVDNLLWIRDNTLFSVALDDWERQEKLMYERADQTKRGIWAVKNEVYQMVGFVAVFQGVVLTAVTQLTQAGKACKMVWSPVLLTGMAWAVTAVGVWQKFSRIQTLEDEFRDLDGARKAFFTRSSTLRDQGRRFTFSQFEVKNATSSEAPSFVLRMLFTPSFVVVFVVLTLFTGVFMASYFLILCGRGLAPIRH